ncbi:MAG: hypothetical protein DRP47_01645 [Candidatus Zixiibacteriota bacterium]|nr:MAG: hypothetical protein DRP47_01645 [candidate division Zixibacteria bacterium]
MKKFLGLLIGLSLLSGVSLAVDEMAYVINTSGETLSKIDLTTGVTTNDILPLGSDIICAPNQIVVRDTLAFVVVSYTDEIQVINLNTENTVTFIDLPAGSNPFWMAFYDTSYAYVTNLSRNKLAKIDVKNFSLVGEVSIGNGPEGIMIHDHKAYIANTNYDFVHYQFNDGIVAVYDIPADTVMYEITVGMNPQYLALDKDNRIHVVCTGNYGFGSPPTWGMIYVINPATDMIIDSFATGGSPTTIAIGPDDIAYLAASGYYDSHGSLFSYDAGSYEIYHGLSNPIVVDSGCWTVVAYQDSTIYESNFADFVGQHDSSGVELTKYPLGDGPADLDFNYVPGDLDGDFQVNVADVTYLVGWLFLGGADPRWPVWRANVNADFGYDIADLTYLVSFLFTSGPPPVVGPTWLR